MISLVEEIFNDNRSINEASSRSLVLLDELGAGTDPSEGGALGYAILRELLKKKIKVVASTHLGVLKAFAFHHPRAQNGAMEFDPRTLKPLFRLAVGAPGSSNALVIAERLGISRDILDYARQVMEKPEDKEKVLIEKLEEARLKAEEYRKRARNLIREAEERLARAKEMEAVLLEREAALEREAGRKAEKALAMAREEMMKAVKPMLSGPEGVRKKAQELMKLVENLLGFSPIFEQRRTFYETLKKGMTIRVPKFRFRGPIEKLDRKKGLVCVRLEGGMLMEIPFQDVFPDDEFD